MKIFVKDYDFKSLPFVYSQPSQVQRFMTSNGVYEFHKDGFYEIQYKEVKRDVRKMKHLEFLIEDVRVRRLHKTFHIPYDHFFVEEKREEVLVAPGITLVKETYHGKEDYYFETQEENAKLFIQLFGILV
jgi:hypothetical protein